MQQALALFDEIPVVETLLSRPEDQWFDRKGFRIQASELANWMIGFANADGGRIAIGIQDKQIQGINSSSAHLNDLLQAAINHTAPPVRHSFALLDCVNATGQPDRLLLLDVEASETLHRNRAQQCFLRVGDENRRLSMTEERELVFDKSEASYDKTLVHELTRDDLDMEAVQEYAVRCKINSLDALMRTRGLHIETPYRHGLTQAAWLLFGKTPPIWSYVRYMRYDGTTAETGTRSNLIKDVRMEGTIPSIVEQAKALVAEELQVIRLTPSGRFQSVSALPEFAWLEAIVNAVTHRSYSLYGDGIRIRHFTDRMMVESPGRLPGLVRVKNIRNSRFARNPNIARVLAEITDYVRESNEGVERMFQEMQQSGLRAPEYDPTESSVRVTLYKLPGTVQASNQEQVNSVLSIMRQHLGESNFDRFFLNLKAQGKLTTHASAPLLGLSDRRARDYLGQLETLGLIARHGKSRTDPTAVWMMTEAPFWKEVGH